MANITELENARVMRARGWPLNTEVVDRGELPKPCSDAIAKGFKKAIKFRECVFAHVEKPTDKTARAMERAFVGFMKATEPPPGDSQEDQIIRGTFASEFGEIREQWLPIFEKLYNGEEVDVRGVWPFKPTEATKRRERM